MTWPTAIVTSTAILCIAAIANNALQGWLAIRKQPYVRTTVADMELELRGEPAAKYELAAEDTEEKQP